MVLDCIDSRSINTIHNNFNNEPKTFRLNFISFVQYINIYKSNTVILYILALFKRDSDILTHISPDPLDGTNKKANSADPDQTQLIRVLTAC